MDPTPNPTPKKGPPKWVKTFLKVFAEAANVSAAARKAKVNRQYVYEFRAANPWFAELFAEADEIAKDAIDEEIHRRAVKGTLRPVFQGGRKVGLIREYSDTLLIFLAKARNPEKYRETSKIQVGGDPNAPPMQHEHKHTVTDRIDDLLADAFARAARREEEGRLPSDGAGKPVDPGPR